MKNQKVRAMLTRLFRLCVVLLLLPSLLLVAPLQARAAAVNVISDGSGGYKTDDVSATPVFPITVNATDWSIAGVTVGENTYSDGTAFYAPAGPADVTLTYIGETITAERIQIDGATVAAGDTANTFIAKLTGITHATTLAITVTPSPSTITLTFPANDFYTIYHGDQWGTEYQNFSGADFNFDLRLNPEKYAIPAHMTNEDLQGIVTDCIITTSGSTIAGADLNLTIEPSPTTEPIIGGAIKGTIRGANLAESTEISFVINTAPLLPTVSVTDTSPGAGYDLVVKHNVLPGAMEGQIWVAVIVDAAYNNSTPVFAAAGYEIGSEPGGQDIAGGAKQWNFFINLQSDKPDKIFDSNIPVTVSGIVSNDPPPSGGDSGGGDSGGYEEPAIRVENELNKDDVKSDTTLWPAHTTESGGVSTTTVTDAELKALLELARQHAKDTEGIPGEGLKEGIFSIEDLRPSSQNNTYVLELTGDQLHTLEQENWDRLTVQTPAGSFSLYSEALTQAGAEITDGNQPVRITLQRLDHENRPGVDASLTVNKNQVTSFETPYGVRIVVPYTPAPGEDVNALIIDYIHEDGTVERVTECHYDPEAGGVVFFTTHLSKFGVAYRPAAFADVTAKHWANPYVTFLASRGVISGDGGKKFRPDDLATRGETIAMLTKALSAVKCPQKPIQVYTDVKLSSSISGASNWLYFNNLAPFFTTGTQLKPSAPVAKQDVAALVNNITDGVGLRLRSRGLDTGYTDLGELADYAKPAVVRLTAAGILPMTSNFKFNPKTNLNRGELAQITATLLSNL